jgi:hypothetical protein
MTDYIVKGTSTKESKERFRNLMKENYQKNLHLFEPDTCTFAFGEDGGIVIKTREEGNALLLTPYPTERFKNIPDETVRLEQESRLIGRITPLGYELQVVGK